MVKRTHYPMPTEHTIIRDLAPALRVWFANTIFEPIPENLVAIMQRISEQIKIRRQRKKVDLADQYREIGIDAVAAAVRCQNNCPPRPQHPCESILIGLARDAYRLDHS